MPAHPFPVAGLSATIPDPGGSGEAMKAGGGSDKSRSRKAALETRPGMGTKIQIIMPRDAPLESAAE